MVGRRYLLLGLAIALLAPFTIAANAPVDGADRHLEFVIDVSGSMGGARLSQAKTALHAAIDGLNPTDAGALRSFAGSCSTGTHLRTDFGLDNRDEMRGAVDALSAGGGTPTPAALQAAGSDLDGVAPAVVVLISDGQSTCGDPCPVAQQIADRRGTDFRAITVGFQAPSTAEAELQCIADATGGQYFSADDAEQLSDAINDGLAAARYVAMGDSYSSGEGADDYWVGTDTDYSDEPGNGCRKSFNAYAYAVAAAAESPDDLDFVACSGARTWDFYGSQKPPPYDVVQEAQFLEADLPAGDVDAAVDLVTLTIGGNDMGFEQIIEGCVRSTGFNPCSGRSDEDLDEAMSRLAGEPVSDDAFGDDRTRPLGEVYGDIRARAPGARVLVVGYPQFFKSSGTVFNRCSGVMKVDQLWINEKVEEFNDFLEEQAESFGFEFVPTSDAFEGHRLCEIGGGEEREWFRDLQPIDDPQAQFHPDDDGQAAMAGEIIEQLQEPRPGDVMDLETGDVNVVEVFVEAGRRIVSFFTNWPGSDVELVAISPSGVRHTRDSVIPGTSRMTESVFERLVVNNPEPGEWRIEMVGRELADGGEPVTFTSTQLAPRNARPQSVPDVAVHGRTVRMDGTESSDLDGAISEYIWYVSHPDGSTSEFSGATTSTTLGGYGRFGVTLRVVDDRGTSGWANVEGGVPMLFEINRIPGAVEGSPTVNRGRAGRTVPIMWNVSLNGPPVTGDDDAATSVTEQAVSCASLEPSGEAAEADGKIVAGNPRGRWQFNWATAREQAGSCWLVAVHMADGHTLDTLFELR